MVTSASMHRAYLIQLLAVMVVLTAAIAASLWAANPFGLFPGGASAAANADTDLFWHLRLHKPYAMRQQPAEQIIIGSSRAARLSPAALSSATGDVYNASLPGISLLEMRRMIEHANAVRPLKRVIIGLDYYMFRPGYSNALFENDRLLVSSPSLIERLRHARQALLDYWSSLFSVDALLAAQANYRGAHNSQRQFFADGTWNATVPAHRVGTPVYRMLSEQIYSEFRGGSGELDMTGFTALLDFTQKQDIELVLLVSPLHAMPLNAIDLAGKWPAYLAWQQRLVAVMDARSARARLYAMESSERLLNDSPAAEQPLFKDGVHFTSAVGDSILACIDHKAAACVPGLQPQALTAHSIDGYLNALTGQMHAYRTTRPREYATLKRWLQPD